MKKPVTAKINSIRFGGRWIGTGILTGAVVPLAVWLLSGVFLWGLCIAGVVILAAFAVVFAVEMHQDFGKIPYYERHLKETIPFDSQKQYAVIRSSVCTGEKIAGFKNTDDGHFTEVMLIRTDEEEQRFRKIYNLETVKKEY